MWVSGLVQGVGFRAGCARLAVASGVAGWARNLPDGRVEAVFEGDQDAVARLVERCRTGPAYARVGTVEVVDEPPAGAFGFRVQ